MYQALSSFETNMCFPTWPFSQRISWCIGRSGATASAVDGISVRTIRICFKNFIPVVGGIFSDTVDTVVGCSLILKNAIGFTGLVAIFLTILFPVMKIMAMVFIYKLAGAVIQPLGENPLLNA